MRCAPLLLALLLPACAVDQGVEAELSRELPDGSKVTASFVRKWAGGPVSLDAEFDPATGKWRVKWSSDVDLDPAARASLAQAEAQGRLVTELSTFLRAVAGVAVGAPLVPPVVKPSAPQTAEQGGMGPREEQK